ncbi:MAG: hypothetical protein IT427_19390 [Pirellulales bacterium]|nr:hypothetical protein [Pirellulales bacterium]
MSDAPSGRKPTEPAKKGIAIRLSVNRRLEAGDELFDRVLGRMEHMERRRRYRRMLLGCAIWTLVIAAVVAAIVFGPRLFIEL